MFHSLFSVSLMLQAEHISKRYGDLEALHDVSFTVNQGEIVGLLGPNGAGKSTTMKILTGFMIPTKGNVLVDDQSILTDTLSIREKIGYLPENNPLYTDFTTEEFLKYHADIRKFSQAKATAAIEKVVIKCNLEEVYYRPIGSLSKGFRQRVGLAQAILHEPPILILDEPTSGLDPRQIIEIRSLLKELGKHHTILFSTHILQEVEAICSRVVIISKGQVVGEGTPGSLSKTTGESMPVQITIEESIVNAKKIFGEHFEYVDGRKKSPKLAEITLMLDKNSGLKDLFALIAKQDLPVHAVIPQENNLEQAFLDLTS